MRSVRARGRPPHPDVLTPAEWRVLHFVRRGLSNKQIAARFGVSRDAVRYHLKNIKNKLVIETRARLRRWRGVPRDSALGDRKADMATALALGPIGQISRSVRDISQSIDWYQNRLGLPHLYTFGKLSFFDCGGTRLSGCVMALALHPFVINQPFRHKYLERARAYVAQHEGIWLTTSDEIAAHYAATQPSSPRPSLPAKPAST